MRHMEEDLDLVPPRLVYEILESSIYQCSVTKIFNLLYVNIICIFPNFDT